MMEVVTTVSLVEWATLLCLVKMIKMESVVEAYNVTESSADDDVLRVGDVFLFRTTEIDEVIRFGSSEPFKLSGCAASVPKGELFDLVSQGGQFGVPSTVVKDGQETNTIERTSPMVDVYSGLTQCANLCDPVVIMAKYMVHGNWDPGIENHKKEMLCDDPKVERVHNGSTVEEVYDVSMLEAERSSASVLVSLCWGSPMVWLKRMWRLMLSGSSVR